MAPWLALIIALALLVGGMWADGRINRQRAVNAKKFAWRFCPGCGDTLVTAEIEGKQHLKCSSCSFVHWNNPVPVAVALIPTTTGGIILGRRKVDPRAGMLALPAGFVEPNETPEQAAIRESKEEVGIDIEIDRYLGLVMPPGVNQHLHFFLAKPTSQTPVAGSDSLEALPVARDAIVMESIAFPTHRDFITKWLNQAL